MSNNTTMPTSLADTETQYNNPNINEKIEIATHNIKGLNNLVKLQNWIQYCSKNNLHIVSLTETKLKNTHEFTLTNPIYKFFTSNFIPYQKQQRETSLGIALMIHHSLTPYIRNILTYPGTLIRLDFQFPNNNYMCIISTYLPSNHDDLLMRIQRQLNN